MFRKIKKPVVMLIFSYLLLTTGLWMFLTVYSNSYNKISPEHISPVSVTISGETVDLNVIGFGLESSIEGLMPDSKLYFIMYTVSPDELRALVGFSLLLGDTG